MTRRQEPSLSWLLESFFKEHLYSSLGASPHTIRAYRDGLRLYLLFLAQHARRAPQRLATQDMNADTVLAFLNHLETNRGNCPATRNSRLAALRSFAAHALRYDFAHAEQYRRILAIRSKRSVVKQITYLEPHEARTLIEQPNRTTLLGQRDHALLLFLYNTGARVSEALAIRSCDLSLQRPRQVRLSGKGGKERVCPLWTETTRALQPITRRAASVDSLLFVTSKGTGLSRDAVARLLDKYIKRAADIEPSLRRKHVTPHVLRHSCAVALLQAGVDLTVIRDYLGHASVSTTNRYLATNIEMKRKVIDAFWKRSGLAHHTQQPWRPTSRMLTFLESL